MVTIEISDLIKVTISQSTIDGIIAFVLLITVIILITTLFKILSNDI